MSQWEWAVNTGDAAQDQALLTTYRQQAAAQGMHLDVQPSQSGGFIVRAVAGAAPQAGFAPPQQGFAPPPQQQGFAPPQQQGFAPPMQASAAPYTPPPNRFAPVAAGAAVASLDGASDAGVAPLGEARVRYLRKVYGLLTAAAFVAIFVGFAVTALSPTEKMRDPYGHAVAVPMLVALMLRAPALQYAMFGALFVATIVASWISKVRYLNVAALLGVSALMGLQAAPMIFIAQWKAAMGTTISSTPVTSTFLMVGLVFVSITAYIFVTRKDFSFLGAALTMGFFVIFGAGILAIFLKSDVFSLAVASAGAIFSGVFLLYVTSYIFRNSEMDDPVGDALALLVQLRNLFVFLLRIFMSRD